MASGKIQAAMRPTIPALAFAIYQGMFATITPAIISGAIVERMSFRAYLVFLVVWALAVYAPVAHWVWGEGGWIRTLGALDFAGGTVVHITAGVAALVCAWMLGPRHDFRRAPLVPHNVPFVPSWCCVCCGSVGSDSTVVPPLVPTALPHLHLSPRI